MPTSNFSRSNLKHQTRLAFGLIPLLNMIEQHGGKSEDLLNTAQIRQVEFIDPAFTITLEQELKIIGHAIEHLNKTDIDVPSLALARFYHLHNFSVLGLAIRSCANLGEAFELIRRYPRLQWGICETQGEIEGEQIIFKLITGDTQVERFLLERDMACIKTIFSEALGKELNVDAVYFSHPEPENKAAYEAFFNCPVKFGQKNSTLSMSIDCINQLIPSADKLSLAFYEAQCARLSAEIDEPFRYTSLVRDYLSRTTPVPTLEQLSDELNIEPRTLQRYLKKEEQSFSNILKEVRSKRAQDRLLFTTMSFEQIADELGFNDATAFSHAFKQWHAMSPREWRSKNS